MFFLYFHASLFTLFRNFAPKYSFKEENYETDTISRNDAVGPGNDSQCPAD